MLSQSHRFWCETIIDRDKQTRSDHFRHSSRQRLVHLRVSNHESATVDEHDRGIKLRCIEVTRRVQSYLKPFIITQHNRSGGRQHHIEKHTRNYCETLNQNNCKTLNSNLVRIPLELLPIE